MESLIIYEVFPRNHTREGTFQALARDLRRIRLLGADYIWLMPIHPIGKEGRKGSKGSPYAIQNYLEVHPELGTLEDFKALVRQARAEGLKVMIDIVFHHTANDALWVKEHPEWYQQFDGKLGRKVADWTDILDLNLEHPELQAALIEVLKFWAQHVDGFRCDVAPLIPLSFWKKAREAVDRVNPDMIWLAETAHPRFIQRMRAAGYTIHTDPEMHQVFDLTYDYDGFERLERYLQGEMALSMLPEYLYVQDTLYPDSGAKLRFLENHDQLRAAQLWPCREQLKQWTAFMFMQKGATLLYAGQEYALEHAPDLFSHDPLDWEHGDASFESFVRQLVRLKKAFPRYPYEVREVLQGVVVVQRGNYLGVFNLEQKRGMLPLQIRGIDKLSGQRVESTPEGFRVSREPQIIHIEQLIWNG